MPQASAVALFGLFYGGNLGNEATLAAAVQALRRRLPQHRIGIVSPMPPMLAQLPAIDASWSLDPVPVSLLAERFRPARFRAPVHRLLEALAGPWRRRALDAACADLDLLLVPGTGVADDLGQRPHEAPLQLAGWCTAAQRRGVPVRFASIGAGPVTHPQSRSWFRAALQAADYRSYREHSSLEFAQQLGVDVSGDTVQPDLVFSLPVSERLLHAPIQWPPRTVALGVMKYSGWNLPATEGAGVYARYLKAMARLATGLIQCGVSVRLIIGNRDKDTHASRQLVAAVPGVICSSINSYSDVLAEIAASDLVIATRFHNILKGFVLGRPAISIGYAAKNDDLMHDMGLGDYCHAADSVDADLVLAQFGQMCGMAAPPTASILEKRTAYRQLLEQQYDRLVAGLAGSSVATA